jgi:hypothetical protein
MCRSLGSLRSCGGVGCGEIEEPDRQKGDYGKGLTEWRVRVQREGWFLKKGSLFNGGGRV